MKIWDEQNIDQYTKSFSKKKQSSKGCDGIRDFKALPPAYLGYWFLHNNSNTLLTLMSCPCVSPILFWTGTI